MKRPANWVSSIVAIVAIGVLATSIVMMLVQGCQGKQQPSVANRNKLPPGIVSMDLSKGYRLDGTKLALDLLRLHESQDGTQMVGDGGKARGWLHQHEDHWREGCEQWGVKWPWPQDTEVLSKCEMVAIGYWMRHASPHFIAGDTKELIRRFRLPYDPYREDNDRYLDKVMGGKR